MNLSQLLQAKAVDSATTLVLRHSPKERELSRVLPWLAAEKPDLFNAYQQTQSRPVETQMSRARHVASFIARPRAKALFVGLYSVGASTPLTREAFWRTPAYVELKRFGLQGFREDDPRHTLLWFDLSLLDFYRSWAGKLIIEWPGGPRNWSRWASQKEMPVHAILEESALTSAMPDWRDIAFGWAELSVLPSTWQVSLRQWRGVYLIFDASDGKSYVGSAYGSENLLGRWLNYAAGGHGGNKLLRERNPANFRFTILERVSPDLPAEDVIHLESSWKDRLHTRRPYGLNDN